MTTSSELLAEAKAKPGTLNLGTINIGSTQNLAAELFKTRAGVDLQVVPFNGTPPVITALRGGEIDVMVDILGGLMPQIGSKALRPLAVMGAQRAPQLPDVPTVKESGVPGFVINGWYGILAPAGTPPDVVAKLNQALNKAVRDPKVASQLTEAGYEVVGTTPEAFGSLIDTELVRWREAVQASGAKIE